VNIGDALAQAAADLAEHDVPDARKDAALLVSFATGRDKAFLIAHPESLLLPEQRSHLVNLVARRCQREPLQYILGRQEFFGLEFEVTPDVLIPRPETEVLVEKAIEILYEVPNPQSCEIGVGSGCISISILHAVKTATALAVDISPAAIEVANRNAIKHQVSDRLNIFLSDVFNSVSPQTFDLIVSNPPYVPAPVLETLQPEVRDHEPTIALTSGQLGLDIIERLVTDSPAFLRSRGALLFELGLDQSEQVRSMFDTKIWSDIEFLFDLQGIPRILYAVKR